MRIFEIVFDIAQIIFDVVVIVYLIRRWND